MTTAAMIRVIRRYARFATELVADAVSPTSRTPEPSPKIAPDIQSCKQAKSLPDSERTPALKSAIQYMQRGDLVSDQTVLDLIAERTGCLRCEAGFLLDGFPRTAPQAEAFAKIMEREKISLDAVLNYELPIAKIVARLSGRRVCPKCKAGYHVTTLPPRVEGVCNHCGTQLEQREDDRPEAVKVRMEVYEKSTKPLIDFYQQRGLLVTVEAEGTPEVIYQRTLAALDSARGSKLRNP